MKMYVFTMAIIGIILHTVNSCPTLCRCYAKTVYCNIQKILTEADIDAIGPNIPLDSLSLSIKNYVADELVVRSFPILTKLNQFYVTNSNISKIPKELSKKMPALISLSIYESKIEVVTKEDFVGLQKLQRLGLGHNGLKRIEDMAFSELPNLVSINVRQNNITSFSAKTFQGPEQLIYLNLEKNLIQSIPEYTFASHSSLGKLELGRNKIKHLFSNSFDGLTKLELLDLEENKIANLPTGLFSALSGSTLIIKLNNNKIKKIPNGLFSNQASLYAIMVNKNEVSEIGDKAFVGITLTAGIDLSSNKIISISASVFEKASVPGMLLAKNPLKCDCGFYKMLAVIQESSKKLVLIGTCSLPVTLSGLPISNSSAIKQSQCSACHLNATCMNNGRCVSFSMTNYTCECMDGFKGERCQTKISSTSSKGVKELALPLVGAFLAIIFVILVIVFVHWYIRRSAVGNRSQKNYSTINA